jgi:two-component system sensor kinase FixL
MATEIRMASPLDAQSLIDALPDATLVLNALEQVEFANRAAERLFGYSASELRGNKINFLFSSVVDPLRAQITRNDISPADASSGYSVVSVRLLDEKNTLHPCMTELTRLAMIGEMAGGIAHELNQPLSAIANYAQAMKWLLESPTPDDAEIRDSLKEITTQAIRAADIVRRLRSLIQKGETSDQPKREPTALNELVSEIKDFVATEARLKSVRLYFDLPPALPPVNIDRLQIQQVVLSLVRNAIEALDDTPREHRDVKVVATLYDVEHVEVSVADTGPGIAPEIETRLFRPYTSAKKGGAGLGLSISQMIVEAHGGALVYRPNEPRGACFSFRLPIAKGP